MVDLYEVSHSTFVHIDQNVWIIKHLPKVTPIQMQHQVGGASVDCPTDLLKIFAKPKTNLDDLPILPDCEG